MWISVDVHRFSLIFNRFSHIFIHSQSCGRGVGDMWESCGRDVGEVWARCGRGAGELCERCWRAVGGVGELWERCGRAVGASGHVFRAFPVLFFSFSCALSVS